MTVKSKTDSYEEKQLAAKICAHLDEGTEALDPKTVDALALARHNALTATDVDHSKRKNSSRFLGMAGALATLTMVCLGIIWSFNVDRGANFLQDDFTLVLVNEDLDILEEDIEFYLWLESQYPDTLLEDSDSHT